MTESTEMNLLQFDCFDAVDIADASDADATMRRFGTLIIEDVQPHGIDRPGRVYRVRNTSGEVFALKTLQAVCADRTETGDIQATPAFERAFLEEYRNTARVSNIKGFPRVHGFGQIGGVSAFLMQWIEGVSLAQAERMHGDTPPDAHTVAQLGLAVIDVLDRTDYLDQPFVHRDLSPSNILIRTDRAPIEQQVENGDFDLYLIDLGSASSITTISPTFTMQFNVFRNGTPAYAAPEMLTNDVSGIDALRLSPSIDVYALCSVLYELYSGTAPYAGMLLDTASPYRTKMDRDPLPLQAHAVTEKPLVAAIMAGIHSEQGERISRRELRARLEAWLGGREYVVDDCTVKTPEHLVASASKGACESTDAAAPRSPMLTRRHAIALAGVAAVGIAAAGAATRGFGIIDRMNGIKGGLDEYTWDEITELADRIAAAKSDEEALEIALRYHLVDEEGSLVNRPAKPVELAEGVQNAVRLIGIRHDQLADGSGACGLSFMLEAPLVAKSMNTQPVSSGGWETSEARAWLNEHGVALFPKELQTLIRTVRKKTDNIGGTKDPASVTETRDRLWLPSYAELVGRRPRASFSAGYEFLADILNSEGNQYLLYTQQNLNWTENNEPLRRTFDGDPCYWWLRTPSPDVSLERGATFFNRVGPDGNPFRYAADSASKKMNAEDGKAGVNTLLPGFCL